MRRIILLLAACLVGCALSANAQEKKVSLGIRAGLNVSNLNYSGKNTNDYDYKSKAGFHVGIVADWNVAENFYIQPGLLLTTRGANVELDYEDYDYLYVSVSQNIKMNAYYLQIPIVASYRFAVNDNVKVDINAGPYFSFGIGGKVKETMQMNINDGIDDLSGTWKYEYDFFGKSKIGLDADDMPYNKGGSDIKRFDAGLRFGAGVCVNKFYIGINYDLGLANILYTDTDMWGLNDKMKNRNFAITLGYNF